MSIQANLITADNHTNNHINYYPHVANHLNHNHNHHSSLSHHLHPHYHHHFYGHSHHHHFTHPHRHYSRNSGSIDLDPIEPLIMQNNFTIKRVESIARQIQVHAKLEGLHDEEARLSGTRNSIASEKSRILSESLNNYQSISSHGSVASGKNRTHSVFTLNEENENLCSSSSESLETIVKESNSPSNKLARNKILLCLLTTGFSLYSVFSIIAPFYPQEAGLKGIPESIYGLVFSSHALAIMLISPLIGKALYRFEIKYLLMFGIFLTGISMILFGFLHYITDTILFGALSFVLRIVGAIGFAIFHTSANIYITKLYPQSIGTVFGFVETFCGFGLSFGPMIGGGLYEWAGFPMPFWVLGTVNLLNIILYYYLIIPLSEIVPEFEEHLSDDPDSPKLTYRGLVFNFKTLLICTAVIVISQNQTFLDPTVEPHLYNAGVKESLVAFTFFFMNAAFAILSPIIGLVSLKVNKYSLMCIGLLISGLSLISLGPPWFLPSAPVSLENTILSMIFMGIGYSFTFIPSFEALLEHAVEQDKFGNLQTYSLVAALYTAVFSLGEAIGPAFGGIFTQCFDFQLSTSIMASVTLLMAFIMFLTRLFD